MRKNDPAVLEILERSGLPQEAIDLCLAIDTTMLDLCDRITASTLPEPMKFVIGRFFIAAAVGTVASHAGIRALDGLEQLEAAVRASEKRTIQ